MESLYNTEYYYVAFVKTSGNETSYGEEQTFTTKIDPDGIEEVHSSESSVHGEDEWYNLNGRKLAAPQKGINIIRMSDGTTRKVLVK